MSFLNFGNAFTNFALTDKYPITITETNQILIDFCKEYNIYFILNNKNLNNIYKEYHYLNEQTTENKESTINIDDINLSNITHYINNSEENNDINEISKLNNLIQLIENFKNHKEFFKNNNILIKSEFKQNDNLFHVYFFYFDEILHNESKKNNNTINNNNINNKRKNNIKNKKYIKSSIEFISDKSLMDDQILKFSYYKKFCKWLIKFLLNENTINMCGVNNPNKIDLIQNNLLPLKIFLYLKLRLIGYDINDSKLLCNDKNYLLIFKNNCKISIINEHSNELTNIFNEIKDIIIYFENENNIFDDNNIKIFDESYKKYTKNNNEKKKSIEHLELMFNNKFKLFIKFLLFELIKYFKKNQQDIIQDIFLVNHEHQIYTYKDLKYNYNNENDNKDKLIFHLLCKMDFNNLFYLIVYWNNNQN